MPTSYRSVRSLLLAFFLFAVVPSVEAAKPDIAIKGGTNSLRENIRQYLSLADESCATPPWRLNTLLTDAATEIDRAAQALGYYELEYNAEITKSTDCWGLALQLIPGKPVLIKEIRIEVLGEGAQDPIFEPLYVNPGIKIGNKLNHGKYETLKARFSTLASIHGYFDGDFQRTQVSVNVAEKSAIVELIYDTGPRYKIGEITIAHDILNEDFLRRYLTIAEGDYYDTDKLLELKNLYNFSNYFTFASASPDLQNIDNATVPINVVLEARKRHEYSAGIGAATDTGPRILFGFEDRYINNRGHSFNANINTSEIRTEAQAVYSIPMRRPAYESLKFYVGYEKEVTDTLGTVKDTYGTQYTYYQNNKWLHTYALEYQQEDSIIGSEIETSTDLIIPSVSFARTKTDGAPYPLSGWSLLGKFSGSPQSLGSDFSFLQFYGRAKYIKSFSEGRLLLRTELGLTETDDFENLPGSVRFFAGGDLSVRGYEYESLGPEKNGEVIGGNNLLVNSIEYDYLIKETNWVVAAFYDQGNAADDMDIEIKRSAGLGVRWISPIGPIRVDVAKALDNDKGWRLHITMGPDL